MALINSSYEFSFTLYDFNMIVIFPEVFVFEEVEEEIDSKSPDTPLQDTSDQLRSGFYFLHAFSSLFIPYLLICHLIPLFTSIIVLFIYHGQ